MFLCLRGERGPKPSRCTISPIASLGNQSSFFPRSISLGKLSRRSSLMDRATDFSLVILLLYSLSTLVPPLPHRLGLTMHLLHALSWRLFHSFGLGLLLRAQSKSKWFVRHYLKHYHYPSDEAGGMQKEGVVKRATEEAFRNWQVVYNISLVMTYGESTIDQAWLNSSLVHWSGLEDLSSPPRLDRWRHLTTTCTWIGELPVVHDCRCLQQGFDQSAHMGCSILVRGSRRLWSALRAFYVDVD